MKVMKRSLALVLIAVFFVMSFAPCMTFTKVSAFDDPGASPEMLAKRAAAGILGGVVGLIPVWGKKLSPVIEKIAPFLFQIKSDRRIILEKLEEMHQDIKEIKLIVSSTQKAVLKGKYTDKIDDFNKSVNDLQGTIEVIYGRLASIEKQYPTKKEIDENPDIDIDVSSYTQEELDKLYQKQLSIATLVDSMQLGSINSLMPKVIELSSYLSGEQFSSFDENSIYDLVYDINCEGSLLGSEAALKAKPYSDSLTTFVDESYKALFIVGAAKVYICENRDAIQKRMDEGAIPKADLSMYDSYYGDNLRGILFEDKGTCLNDHYHALFDEDNKDSAINRYNERVANDWLTYIDSVEYGMDKITITTRKLNPQLGFVDPKDSEIGFNKSYGENQLGTETYGFSHDYPYTGKARDNLLNKAYAAISSKETESVLDMIVNSGLYGVDKDTTLEEALDAAGFDLVNYYTYVNALRAKDGKEAVESLKDDGFNAFFAPSDYFGRGANEAAIGTKQGSFGPVTEYSPTVPEGTVARYFKGYDLEKPIQNRSREEGQIFYGKISGGYPTWYEGRTLLLYIAPEDDFMLESESSYGVDDKAELVSFLKKVANGKTYKGKTVCLEADVDLSDTKYTSVWPISNNGNAFLGTFDGKNHTITGFNDDDSTNRSGLFRTLGAKPTSAETLVGKYNTATVKNLKMDMVMTKTASASNELCGAIAGYAVGGKIVLENIQILSGAIMGGNYVGGLVGKIDGNTDVTIKNCINSAAVTARGEGAGGLVGYYSGTKSCTIDGCTNYGRVIATKGYGGGIIGYLGNNSTDQAHTVTNNTNSGVIVARAGNAGGIIAGLCTDSVKHVVTGNTNTFGVTAYGDNGRAGGIIGFCEGGGTFSDNKNTAGITSEKSDAAGIVGYNEDDSSTYENCKNSGSIKALAVAGGITGYSGDNDNDKPYTFRNCENTGSVLSTESYAGGISGMLSTDSTKHVMESCVNSGSIKGYKSTGGIIGWMEGGGNVTKNKSTGDITSETGYAGGIVGQVEDDACTYTGSSASGLIVGAKGYANICGWDGYKKAPIQSVLLATIFSSGNLWIVISLAVVFVAAIVLLFVFAKKKNKKEVAAATE